MVNKTPLIAAGTFVVGLAAGVVAGAKLVEKKFALEFEERLAREVQQTREFYGVLHKKEYPSPSEAVEKLVPPAEAAKLVAEYSGEKREPVAYHKIVKSTKTEEEIEKDVKQFDEVQQNVFNRPPDEEEDLEIYVISEEEFNEGDSNYMQPTLTWYEGDEILTDENEDRIEDVDGTIGEDWKHCFGQKSSDPKTVHVRNAKLQLEFEVCKNPGYYVVEVLGEDPPAQRPSQRIRGG